MQLQESGEMYLETIYILSGKLEHVRSIDISTHMGYSKPSVSRAISVLRSGGYIILDAENHIFLTESGQKIGEKIYMRHTLLTEALRQLGVAEEIASQDACRVEHAISDETFEAIRRHLNRGN